MSGLCGIVGYSISFHRSSLLLPSTESLSLSSSRMMLAFQLNYGPFGNPYTTEQVMYSNTWTNCLPLVRASPGLMGSTGSKSMSAQVSIP